MLQSAAEEPEGLDVLTILDFLLVVAQDALQIGGPDERDGELSALRGLHHFGLVGEFEALLARVVAVGVDVVLVVEVGKQVADGGLLVDGLERMRVLAVDQVSHFLSLDEHL